MVDKQGQNEYKRRIVSNPDRTQMVIDAAVQRIEKGCAPGLIFVREKLHAKIVYEVLKRHTSAQVAHVSSDVPKKVRQDMAQQLRDGTLQAVVSTPVWGTGLDIPGLRWVIWAGSGQAPIGFLQGRGRGSRVADGKDDFELIIIEDEGLPNHERQGQQRLEHLHQAGMLSDQELIQALREAPASQVQQRAERLPLWFMLLCPLHPLSWAFYGTLVGLMAFLCNVMETAK